MRGLAAGLGLPTGFGLGPLAVGTGATGRGVRAERGVGGPGLAGTAPGFGTAAPTLAVMGEPDFGLAALALVGAALRFGMARDWDLGLGLAGAAAFGGVAFGGEDFGVALGVVAFGLLAGTGTVLHSLR